MAKVLVIDNYPCVIELLREELSREGHTVVGSGDVTAALESLHSARPDVVIFDPYHGGRPRWDTLQSIKRAYPRVPVILFSAVASYGTDPRASAADAFVVKSLILDELKGQISQVLDKKLLSPARTSLGRPLHLSRNTTSPLIPLKSNPSSPQSEPSLP
jgi:DNA-binding NtrC family response regulator